MYLRYVNKNLGGVAVKALRPPLAASRRWTTRDSSGHTIYLTQERWDHITAPMNHPEMRDYEAHLKETIESGQHS